MRSCRNHISFLFLFLVLLQCSGPKNISKQPERFEISAENIRIDSTFAADTVLEYLIYSYRLKLDDTMNRIIGAAACRLYRGKPEAPLNNFIADLLLKRANMESEDTVNAAITNVGGLRINIPPGPITLGKIYELMPFENELVILEMNGSELMQLGKEIGEIGGECIAGMKLRFAGKELIEMTVNDRKLDPNKTYRVATSDYLSSPGRRKLGILSRVPRRFVGVTIREAIIDEIKASRAAGKEITARTKGRIIFED